MTKYFELNGVTGKLPSLVFKDDPSYRQVMDPVLKLGILHTMGEQGFEGRKLQRVMKIAQPKMTMSKRGKKAKIEGKIILSKTDENYFNVPTKKFAMSA